MLDGLEGLLASFSQSIIDALVFFFPPLPSGIGLAALSQVVPKIFLGLLSAYLSGVTSVLFVYILVKIYKLIPFKAS